MSVFEAQIQAEDVRAWQVALVAHPGLRGRIPVEAGASLPTLGLDEQRELHLEAFHFVVLRDSDGRPARYAAFSRVQLRVRDLALTHFAMFDERVLFPNLSLDAPYTTQANGFLELRERSRLKVQVQTIFARLATAFVNDLTAGDDGPVFLRQYSRLLPPSLMPYYRGLNPVFFEWLRNGSGGGYHSA
jgi:hypothetical protein